MRALLAIPFAAVGWCVSASALLCLLTRKMPLFVFPFDQWIQAVRWYREVGWLVRLAIVGSGIVPTIVLILLVVAISQFRRPNSLTPSLYGQSGWADQHEMQQAKMRSRKQAF